MSKPTSVPGRLFVVAIVVVAAVAVFLQWRHQPVEPLPTPLAQVKVAGWTNTKRPPTAEDLAVFVQMMLGRGQYGGARILDEDTVTKMLRPNDVAGRLWGLGWGIRTEAVPNHPSGGCYGCAAIGENFRRWLDVHPLYIHPMSSLALWRSRVCSARPF